MHAKYTLDKGCSSNFGMPPSLGAILANYGSEVTFNGNNTFTYNKASANGGENNADTMNIDIKKRGK